MKDLKVLINEESFYDIQKTCFEKNIGWDSTGLIAKNYQADFLCLYYRYKSNTIQYGKYKYYFDEDLANEVSSSEFIENIKGL